MKARFYGGSLDGEERESHSIGGGFAYRYIVSVPRVLNYTKLNVLREACVETYVRDRDRYERDSNDEVTKLAFKLESTEPYKQTR